MPYACASRTEGSEIDPVDTHSLRRHLRLNLQIRTCYGYFLIRHNFSGVSCWSLQFTSEFNLCGFVGVVEQKNKTAARSPHFAKLNQGRRCQTWLRNPGPPTE